MGLLDRKIYPTSYCVGEVPENTLLEFHMKLAPRSREVRVPSDDRDY